ncbi:MAG: hypothetical protein IKO35_05610, partial [Elusimicrobiaceae bacterium]|nr:hypothetical protein [Elusimicrobiaceae bacterium]
LPPLPPRPPSLGMNKLPRKEPSQKLPRKIMNPLLNEKRVDPQKAALLSSLAGADPQLVYKMYVFQQKLNEGGNSYILERLLSETWENFAFPTTSKELFYFTLRAIHPGHIEGEIYADPYELYPDAPEGLTPDLLPTYIAIQNNFTIPIRLEDRARFVERLEDSFTKTRLLKNAILRDLPPVGKEMDWLASQVESHIKYVLLGTEADVSNNVIADFLSKIRSQMPEREIVFFTDSMPEEFPTMGEEQSSAMKPILETASSLDIRVVGLKPKFVSINPLQVKCREFTTYPASDGSFSTKETTMSIWDTDEGIRLQNKHLLKTIKAHLEKYPPHTLFVIQARPANISYDMPGSLGEDLVGNTFVAEIATDPTKLMGNFAIDLKDIKNVVRYTDWLAARKVGFDAYVIVEK